MNARDDRDGRAPGDARDERDERLATDPRDERDERRDEERAGRRRTGSAVFLAVLIVVLAGLNFWWNARTEAQTKAATIAAAAVQANAAVAATKAAIQRDDQQWCSLLGAIIAAPVPQTAAGVAFRQKLDARYQSLGCVNGSHPRQ